MHLRHAPKRPTTARALRQTLTSLNRLFVVVLLCTFALGAEACDSGTDIGPDGEVIPSGNLVVMDAYYLLRYDDIEPKDDHMFTVVEVVVRNPGASALLISPVSFRIAVGGLELGPTLRTSAMQNACPTGFISPGGLVQCKVVFEVADVPSRVIFASSLEGDATPVRREADLKALDLLPIDIAFFVTGLNEPDAETWFRGEDTNTIAVKPVRQKIWLDLLKVEQDEGSLAFRVYERRGGVKVNSLRDGHPNFRWDFTFQGGEKGLVVDVEPESRDGTYYGFQDSTPFELVVEVERSGYAPVEGLNKGREISILFVPEAAEN